MALLSWESISSNLLDLNEEDDLADNNVWVVFLDDEDLFPTNWFIYAYSVIVAEVISERDYYVTHTNSCDIQSRILLNNTYGKPFQWVDYHFELDDSKADFQRVITHELGHKIG